MLGCESSLISSVDSKLQCYHRGKQIKLRQGIELFKIIFFAARVTSLMKSRQIDLNFLEQTMANFIM